MAASDMPMRGVGTTLKIGSGASAIEVGRLSSIGELTCDSDELEITTLDSEGGYREYIQGFKDSGTLDLEGYFTPGDAGQLKLYELYGTGAQSAFEVDFPDDTKVELNGYVKTFKVGSTEVDNPVGFGASIRVSGKPTVTPAA